MDLLDIQYGTVISVNSSAVINGRATPMLGVKSELDGSTLTIPLRPAAWEQSQPLVGYKVLFFRLGRFESRIIKLWGNDEEFTRRGQFGLDPGEVFIQSPAGLAYLKLDKDGRVRLVSGDLISALTFDDAGCTITSSQVRLSVSKREIIEIAEDGTISLQRLDTEGETRSSVVLGADDTIEILAPLASVTIRAKDIYLDGQVYLGKGASDPLKRTLFGDVVTGGPLGTHPVDFATGIPIIGSPAVKAAGLGGI